MRRHLIHVIALAALLAVTACGARLSDSEMAAARARQGVNAGAGESAAGATTTTLAAGGGAAAGATGGGATGATGGASGGTGAAAGGGATGGSGGGGAAAATGCAPTGATDVGVSPTELKIGLVTTLSGPVPGLGLTSLDGAKAYVAYANSQGGVCGRKLVLESADDRLDAGTNRSETQRLASEVFGFAGGFSVLDDGGASVLQGTNIPDVTLAIGDSRISLANNFSPNPINLASGSNGAGKMMAYFKANYGVTRAAIVYPAQAVARASAKRYEGDLAAAGITLVDEFEVAITETNYAPVASQIKSDKIDLVITALEVNGMARLAQAIQQQQYTLKVPFYGAQAYGKQFLSKAGSAANGTTLGLAYAIFEDAPSNPAVNTFLSWYQRTNPGADIDFFAVESWAAVDMFVQAATAAGGDITRDKVLQQLSTYTTFDAHGLLAPINPAGKKPSACFMVVTVENGAWKRVFPDAGFSC